jgi:pyruvate kinase
MVRIASEIERSPAFDEGPKYDMPMRDRLRVGATPTEHAIAAATVQAVRHIGSPVIVTFTRTGGTSRLVSSYRPPVPIVAICDSERTRRQLALVWGVRPVVFEDEPTYETMIEHAREYLTEQKMAEKGQRFVVTAGVPFHVAGTTNMLRVEEL